MITIYPNYHERERVVLAPTGMDCQFPHFSYNCAGYVEFVENSALAYLEGWKFAFFSENDVCIKMAARGVFLRLKVFFKNSFRISNLGIIF